jgi:hypothetical protein
MFFSVRAVEALNEGKLQRRGDYLTIKLVEIGVGDEFFTWWGHLGIIVENALTGKSLLYDYGVFSFQAEHFYRNLIAGNWYYTMMVRDANSDIDWYIQNNRDITFYTLNLSAKQKEAMVDFLDWNALPENRRYYYKIFTDNCVTRVMLLLDDILEGRFLERYANETGRITVRAHANRHLYRSPTLYWLLNFIMGQNIDTPPVKSKEMFLPEEFCRNAADFWFSNEDGETVRLVSGVETVNVSKGRKLPLYNQPRAYIPGAGVGAGIALLFAFMLLRRFFMPASKSKRRLLGIAQAFWGLFLGICGTLLFYAAFFSNHIYTYDNINVVFMNPLLLTVVPFGLASGFAKKQKTIFVCETALKTVWTYVFLAAGVTILVKVSPEYFQVNYLTLIMVMPSAFILSFAGTRLLKLSRPVKNSSQ